MKKTHKISLAILLIMTIGGIVGMVLTNRPDASLQPANSPVALSAQTHLIDPQYLDTAHQLSALATTTSEVPLAEDILRATNHEMDLQFAAALEVSANTPIPQTPQVRSIQNRISRLENALQAKVKEVEDLTDAVKKARPSQKDSVQAQLEVSQAELNLYREAFSDAQQDLMRVGGDPHGRIQELVDEHNASNKVGDAKLTPSGESPSPPGLVAKISQWNGLRQKQDQILAAQQAVYSGAAEIAKTHDALETQFQAAQSQRKTSKALSGPGSAGSNLPQAGTLNNAGTQPDVAAVISSLKQLSDDRKALGILDRRIQSLQEAGSDYGGWAELVKAQKLLALHRVIVSAFGIVLTLLAMFLMNRATEHLFSHVTLEARQRATLQGVLRISVQAIAVIVILIAIFGPPNQLSTVLGLAGAGLTVVLKDFIVSFLGWFVLMGRNGIHVGDWVEINGVRGEVIEISLLRTILLETGNWTDAGQPTGRQVAFLNQYAVDGYYFNFTTSGQWLWDELQVLIPRGQNPYPIIEEIRGIANRELEKYAQEAESEWRRVSQHYGVRSFSALPSITVRQTDNGVVANVRYITRVPERAETRYRLNHAFVKLLNQGEDPGPVTEALPAPT